MEDDEELDDSSISIEVIESTGYSLDGDRNGGGPDWARDTTVKIINYEDDKKSYGYLNGLKFSGSSWDGHNSIMEIDELSQDYLEISEAFNKVQEEFDYLYEGTIFFLDRIEINKELRGKGLGKALIRVLENYLINQESISGESFIFLKPWPVDEYWVGKTKTKEFKKAYSLIENFYLSLGYKPTPIKKYKGYFFKQI